MSGVRRTELLFYFFENIALNNERRECQINCSASDYCKRVCMCVFCESEWVHDGDFRCECSWFYFILFYFVCFINSTATTAGTSLYFVLPNWQKSIVIFSFRVGNARNVSVDVVVGNVLSLFCVTECCVRAPTTQQIIHSDKIYGFYFGRFMYVSHVAVDRIGR